MGLVRLGLLGEQYSSRAQPAIMFNVQVLLDVHESNNNKTTDRHMGDSGHPRFNFLQYPSHRIFGHMHEALNVFEKITNYTV